jgi:hypothetical protein
MKDINILILVSCVIFLLLYFKFINLNLNLSRDLIILFNNPFFRLFLLIIVILISHDCDFIIGIITSIIYILILDQGIKGNKMK